MICLNKDCKFHDSKDNSCKADDDDRVVITNRGHCQTQDY